MNADRILTRTRLSGLALFALTAAALAWYPQLAPPAAPPDPQPGALVPDGQTPLVEAVFVLDATGSMGGLIATAKEKIWSIATTMASAEPAPQLRMGLVIYRDRGDDYVTRVFGLTSELDRLHAELMDVQAQGGGDEPESVTQALRDAVTQIAWTPGAGVYRTIFLVGDAPPHLDYADEPPYPEVLASARQRGIHVNAIQCGSLERTMHEWQRIAQLGGGRYLRVEQAGSAIALNTPYDAELARLAAALDATRVYYGDADRRAAKAAEQTEIQARQSAAPPAALARRAEFTATAAGAASVFGADELVEAVTSGQVALERLAPETLPAPLAALDTASRQERIAELARERAELRQSIATLSAQRAEHLKAQVAVDDSAAGSLDRQLFDVVQEQGAAEGLRYDREDLAY